MENHVKDHAPSYERPDVVDYGTLVDITRAGGYTNRDAPTGSNNTAWPNS